MSLSEEHFVSTVGIRGIQTPITVSSPLFALKAFYSLVKCLFLEHSTLGATPSPVSSLGSLTASHWTSYHVPSSAIPGQNLA